VPSEALNALVTSGIWRAQQLEAHGIGSASQAWAEVSFVEEELAKTFLVSQGEGRIARRGAVRAALKAGDYTRAQELSDSYANEKGATKALKGALREMLAQDARAMETRFRFASKHLRAGEARHLARHFHDAGPFGLAAYEQGESVRPDIVDIRIVV
jgi:hypothetical protein